MKEIFDRLILTLGQIEVRGEENLDMLLGCIRLLKKMRGMIKAETREIEEEKEDDDQGQGREDVRA